MPKLIEIEGLGDLYVEKLRQAGVRSTNDLLQKAATSKGRREIGARSGIETKRILVWANQADLMRIKGISTLYAVLLEACGVDNTAELALRDPKKLHERMQAVNEKHHLVQRLPSVEEIQDWIDQALDLPRLISY
jgi:predicted flap endonuclease-1-like 5' DNA nuclease